MDLDRRWPYSNEQRALHSSVWDRAEQFCFSVVPEHRNKYCSESKGHFANFEQLFQSQGFQQ